jgi:hypothetical protein
VDSGNDINLKEKFYNLIYSIIFGTIYRTNVKLSKNQQKKENRLKLESMISSDSLDEHRQNGLMSIMSYSGSGISTASFRGKGSSNNDSLRNDAINAYRDLKQKKRQAFSEY